MAISIDYETNVIFVPKADTTLVGINPVTGLEIRELDIAVFGPDVADLQDDEDGMPFPTAYFYTAPKDIGGVTLAPVLEIFSPYTVTIEDGNYAVNLVGGNTNLPDLINVNSVSVRAGNTAGLVITDGGGGGGGNTPQEIADAVWEALVANYTTPGTMGEAQGTGTPLNPSDVADAVWDAQTVDYNLAGSMGEAVQSPSGLTPGEAAQLQAIFDKLPADNEDMASTLEVTNLIGAGLSSTQASQLATIFAKLPLDDISGVADVNALIGQGLTAAEANWLQTIFNRLPSLSQSIAGVDDVAALSGDGLSATQASQLQSIFDKLPAGVENIASDADVTALIGQGLDATQAAQLASIFAKLPVDDIAGVLDVNALIGQGLTSGEATWLQEIHNRLPNTNQKIAGVDDVGAIDSPWSTAEKDQLIVDLETTKRQALKAANNTEAPN
jgi:hypothetical protein